MSKLGRCPDCPAGTRERILIGGKCPYHRGGIGIPLPKLEKLAKPIPKQSKKMKEDLKEYTKLQKQFLKEHQVCEAHLEGCNGRAEEIHHKVGRGKNLLNVKEFLATCRSCHYWITENSAEAIKRGLSTRRNQKPNK